MVSILWSVSHTGFWVLMGFHVFDFLYFNRRAGEVDLAGKPLGFSIFLRLFSFRGVVGSGFPVTPSNDNFCSRNFRGR